MNRAACQAQLKQLLQTQNDHITRANDYLAVLKQAISEGRLDGLQQSLSHPDLAIDEIEKLEAQRQQLLADSGFAADRGGLANCIAWCDDDNGRLAELYKQLLENLYQLRHSIQVNSLLVNRGQQRVRRSIGVLTGTGNSGFARTYGDKGQTIDPSARRDIAIA